MTLECPQESCSYSTETETGLKVHYGQMHDEPYPGNVKECAYCGDEFSSSPSEDSKYCKHECFVEDSKGQNRGFGSNEARYRNEEWLTEKHENGKSDEELAEECDVQVKTIQKWRDKFEIGLEYDCPSCEKSFSSLKGRNSHHKHVHDESIRGSEYECEWCGGTFTDNRSPNHSQVPKYCEDCYGEHMEGDNNPNKDEERQEKISRGLINAYAEGRRTPQGRKTYVVEETGHEVDSQWEVEVDILLHELDIDYIYNGHSSNRRYEIEDFTHAPDFIIPASEYDIILEVKGGRAMHHYEEKMRTIAKEMTSMDGVKYIVYGEELESHAHIDYGNEEKLSDVILSLADERQEKNSILDY